MHNPSIFILMESKVNSHKAQQIIPSLNMFTILKFHRNVFKVGYDLLWTNKFTFQLEIVHTSNLYIHRQIQVKFKNKKSLMAWNIHLWVSTTGSS